MTGINWKYKDDPKSTIFWSSSSDTTLYLGRLLIDFDFTFNQSLGERTPKFQLTTAQIDYLISGIEIRLDELVQKFDPEVPLGLTFVNKVYKGKQLKLFIKMSRNHRLIDKLIRFRKFLTTALEENKKIIFWGGNLNSQ